MNQPLLTIGISVHNAGEFLELALRSIFAQTFQDWELILVDDSSTDGSAELILGIRDPRVRVLKSGSKRGLAARLNQIVLAARAPYIARMDADDMLDDSRLEKQMDFLRDHPDVDVVGCGLAILDSRGQPSGLRLFGTEHATICADPLQGIRLAHATVVGKTEWFRKHRYNEENRNCEDWELWFNSYKTSVFANLNEPLYYYREFASFSIRKYIDAKCWMARMQWHHRADFGLLRSSRVCLSQYIRILLNLFAYVGGLQRHMIRRRSKRIDQDTRAHVLAATNKSLNYALPLVRASASIPTKHVSHSLKRSIASAQP